LTHPEADDLLIKNVGVLQICVADDEFAHFQNLGNAATVEIRFFNAPRTKPCTVDVKHDVTHWIVDAELLLEKSGRFR